MTDVAPVLRRARPEDDSAIAGIRYVGRRRAPGQRPRHAARRPSRDSFDVRAAERVGENVVATVDGVVAGFVMVDRDEVDQVYVAAAHRGTGSAALLLAAAEERVRAEGHARAWFAVVAVTLAPAASTRTEAGSMKARSCTRLAAPPGPSRFRPTATPNCSDAMPRGRAGP
ncbi:GNAT family N-acetyltransferase [Nocardia beijingensis]|uniref:GNAT family N-acetyltransferase n=1 Tax=Nocardia beijingensis TaxID=95162 RepID=UPI001E3730C3|nr:GNAT family N-acetyltransferase [Nocardia beijingensis]